MTQRSTRKVRLNSPYGCWRLEDGDGSVLIIPNGIVGDERIEGGVSFFQGRAILNVPMHWREPVADGEHAPKQEG